MANGEQAKKSANEAIRRSAHALIELSHRIHASPELAFEEHKSSEWVADALSSAGYAVTKPAFDIPTAFTATLGSGPLHLAICAEYDCLPGIGHACGHNIIASSAVGAGIGLAKLANEVGLTVTVIGTPAEELGEASGKILLLERGAFQGVHAAMMVHPAPFDVLMPRMTAVATFDVEYTGKAAHAAAWPEQGVNAGDAMTVAQTAIALLRQQMLPTDRVHGIVTKWGDAANIIPALTTARYMTRSEYLQDLGALQDKVLRCFEAGAVATGAHLHVIGGVSPYAHVVHDEELAQIYGRNAASLGRSFRELGRVSGSTDMGNVSQVIPSIHPFMGIESSPAVNHQPEFAACCIQAPADTAVIDASVAMAWTALDIASTYGVRNRLLARP